MSAFSEHRKCTINKSVKFDENKILQGQGHEIFFLEIEVCRVLNKAKRLISKYELALGKPIKTHCQMSHNFTLQCIDELGT